MLSFGGADVRSPVGW